MTIDPEALGEIIITLHNRLNQFETFLEELSTPIGEMDYPEPFIDEINRLLQDYGVPFYYVETDDENNPVSFRPMSHPAQE